MAKTHIYYAYGALDYSIRRSTLAGADMVTTITLGSSGSTSMALDEPNGHIYYVTSQTIHRMNTDGSGDITVNADETEARGVDLDLTNGYIYYTASSGGGNGKIKRMDLDGTNVITLIDHSTQYFGFISLDLTNSKMYWTRTNTPRNIYWADLDGSNEAILIANGNGFQIQVAPTLSKVYWAESVNDEIKRADLDGANPETLIDLGAGGNGSRSIVLDLDAGKMYFGVYEGDNTRSLDKSDLDGANRENVWEEALLGQINDLLLATLGPTIIRPCRWSDKIYVRKAGSTFGSRCRRA